MPSIDEVMKMILLLDSVMSVSFPVHTVRQIQKKSQPRGHVPQQKSILYRRDWRYSAGKSDGVKLSLRQVVKCIVHIQEITS